MTETKIYLYIKLLLRVKTTNNFVAEKATVSFAVASVCESLGLLVADLLEVGDAGEVDHGGRAAHEDEGVLGRREEVLADHLLVDEARAVFPAYKIGRVTFWNILESRGKSSV